MNADDTPFRCIYARILWNINYTFCPDQLLRKRHLPFRIPRLYGKQLQSKKEMYPYPRFSGCRFDFGIMMVFAALSYKFLNTFVYTNSKTLPIPGPDEKAARVEY